LQRTSIHTFFKPPGDADASAGSAKTNFAAEACSLLAGEEIMRSTSRPGRRVIPLLVIAALAAAPAPARAGDLLKPVRTLVYEVALTVGIVHRTPRAAPSTLVTRGIGRASRAQGIVQGASGGPTENVSRAGVETRGTIAVDVIAATGDGGLVADISETAPGRTHAKVRLAVSHDGSVVADPKFVNDVTEEEVSLARWLARGFYSDHPREAGTLWTVDQSGNGVVAAEHYRVLSAANQRVTLAYALEQSDSAASFALTRQGSLVYDTGFIVPISATYEAQARRQLFEAVDETHTSVVLKLTADSFAKKS
jgi:hypothetical protein